MSPYTNLLIIKQPSKLRAIDDAEALTVLSEEEYKLPREIISVDMQPYSIEGGVWDDSQQYILQQGRNIKQKADEKGTVKLFYLGLARFPT